MAIFGPFLPKFSPSSIISTILALQIAEKVFVVIENYMAKIQTEFQHVWNVFSKVRSLFMTFKVIFRVKFVIF